MKGGSLGLPSDLAARHAGSHCRSRFNEVEVLPSTAGEREKPGAIADSASMRARAAVYRRAFLFAFHASQVYRERVGATLVVVPFRHSFLSKRRGSGGNGK